MNLNMFHDIVFWTFDKYILALKQVNA